MIRRGRAITIHDNGKGVDPKQKMKSHGLIGMKRRAKDIGAMFNLESSYNGTRIELTWPGDVRKTRNLTRIQKSDLVYGFMDFPEILFC